MTHDLLALAERIERAEGPDRELDADIAVAVNAGSLEGAHKERAKSGRRFGYVLHIFRGSKSLQEARHYTGSLDAAMSLVPEGWTRLTDNTDGREVVELYCPDYDKHGWVPQPIKRGGHPSSLAHAMSAAALRARAAMRKTA